MATPTSSPLRVGGQLLSANKKLWSRYAEGDERSHSLLAVLYRLSRLPLNHKTGISIGTVREAIEASNSIGLGEFLSAIYIAMGVKSEVVSYLDEIVFHRVQNCVMREETMREMPPLSPMSDMVIGADFSPRDMTVKYQDVKRRLYLPTTMMTTSESRGRELYELKSGPFDGYKERRSHDDKTFRREYESVFTSGVMKETALDMGAFARATEALTTPRCDSILDAAAYMTKVMKTPACARATEALTTPRCDSILDAAAYMTKVMKTPACAESTPDFTPYIDTTPDTTSDEPTLTDDTFGYWA